MKKLTFILGVIFLIIVSTIVIASYSITRTEPGAYAIMNDTIVQFGINATGDNTSFNCSVYIKTSLGDNYSQNTTFTVINNTVNATNITFVDDTRVWWKIGCWDRENGLISFNESVTLPSNATVITFTYGEDGVTVMNGVVNDSGGAYRDIVVDQDYNFSSGVLHLINASIVGNTTLWNYSYPYNSYVNEVNTTVRIFDVDDYYDEFIEIFMPIKLTGSIDAPICDSTSAGGIYYDTDGFTHYGCNSSHWVGLY